MQSEKMAHLPIAPRVKADVCEIFKPAIALQRNPIAMLEGQAKRSAHAMVVRAKKAPGAE